MEILLDTPNSIIIKDLSPILMSFTSIIPNAPKKDESTTIKVSTGQHSVTDIFQKRSYITSWKRTMIYSVYERNINSTPRTIL